MIDKTPDALLPCPQSLYARLMNNRLGNKNPNGSNVCVLSDDEIQWIKSVADPIATPHAEAVRVLVEALRFVRHRDSRWVDDDVVTPALSHPAVVAALEGK